MIIEFLSSTIFIFIIGAFYYINRFKIKFDTSFFITIFPLILSLFILNQIFLNKKLIFNEFIKYINFEVITLLISFLIIILVLIISLKISKFYLQANHKKTFLFNTTFFLILFIFYFFNYFEFFLWNTTWLFLIIILSITFIFLLNQLNKINFIHKKIYFIFENKLNILFVFTQIFDSFSRIIDFELNKIILFENINFLLFILKIIISILILWFLDNQVLKNPKRKQLTNFTKITIISIGIINGLMNIFS